MKFAYGLCVLLCFVGSQSWAQVTCQQIENTTYCNGQLQPAQGTNNFNWLPYLQTPNVGQAIQQGRQAALQNQLLQQQIRAQELQNEQDTAALQRAVTDGSSSNVVENTAPSPSPAPAPLPPVNLLSGYTTGGRDTMEATSYIKGASDAFMFANADLVIHGKQPIYCLPRELGLNMENLRQIIDTELAAMSEKSRQDEQDMPISMILLEGLKKTFPCPSTVLNQTTARHKH